MSPGKEDGPKKDLFVEVTFLLVGLFLFSLILAELTGVLNEILNGSLRIPLLSALLEFLISIWPVVKWISYAIALIALYGMYYYSKKLSELNVKEKEIYKVFDPKVAPEELRGEIDKNEKWEAIQKHIHSSNPSDWRVAIIEADIMLDEFLQLKGYFGDSVGERLKSVDKSDFRTLDSAWEAHKMRNRIAHSGTSLPLGQREAERTISLYEAVFKEFDLI